MAIPKKVRCVETGKIYDDISKAAVAIDVPERALRKACARPSVNGFHFEYIDRTKKEINERYVTSREWFAMDDAISLCDDKEIGHSVDITKEGTKRYVLRETRLIDTNVVTKVMGTFEFLKTAKQYGERIVGLKLKGVNDMDSYTLFKKLGYTFNGRFDTVIYYRGKTHESSNGDPAYYFDFEISKDTVRKTVSHIINGKPCTMGVSNMSYEELCAVKAVMDELKAIAQHD